MSGFSSELLKSLKWTQMITGRLITACRVLSKHTVTFCLPCQCISRCLLTSSSIFPIYCFRLSGFKNEISAPLTRLWSSPLSSIRFRSPRIILTEVVCWLAMVRLSLVNTTYLQPVQK